MFIRTQRAILVLLALAVLLALGSIAQADFGTNWTGQFFNSTDLTGAVAATASYPSGLNVTWADKPQDGLGVTLSAVNADNFSARFTSTQTFQQGTYQFVLFVDDGGRVFIDGVVVIDQFGPGHLGTYTINHDMTAGSHTLVVEYSEVSGQAILQFQWFLQGAAGVTGTVVPTGSPVPAATAQVTSKGLSLRTGPYLGATYIAVARPGTSYNVSARNSDEGIFTWYQITITGASGQQHTGWASGRFLTITGDPNGVPVKGSVFDTIDGAPSLGVKAIPRAIMNLRRRPSIRTQKLEFVPWGGEADLIGRTVQGGKNFWYQVRYQGKVGWILAAFVTVKGDINVVPIR